MSTRRQFCAAGLAAAFLPLRAAAQAGEDFEAPARHVPRITTLGAGLPPGEIHVDPTTFSLYWTLPNDAAIRYAVGIGRGDLYERGEFTIGAKKEWPSWTPTPAMIEREPEQYARYADGMPGGPENPLGARALYLFTPERGDTFLRIHGTSKPQTIGTAVSNGCVRLLNDHIIELYEQVPMGTRVVLY